MEKKTPNNLTQEFGDFCCCRFGGDSLLFWKNFWNFPKKGREENEKLESFISSILTEVGFTNIIQSKLKDFLKLLIYESVFVQIKLVLHVYLTKVGF